jgi:hypothetical protein
VILPKSRQAVLFLLALVAAVYMVVVVKPFLGVVPSTTSTAAKNVAMTNGEITLAGLAQPEAKKQVSVWDNAMEKIARPFSPWQGDSHSWCVKSNSKKCQGLLYLKVPKTGSSTGAGVTLRTVEKVGAKMLNNATCAHQWKHSTSFKSLENRC